MKKYRAFNIKYDTDGKRIKGLPKTVIFDAENLEKAEEISADKVSDETGWCVFSLAVEEIRRGHSPQLKCKYLQVDSDGIEYENVPRFDW